MTIRIVTDSGADLPKEIIERYDITVVPLHLHLEGETYLDGVIAEKEFYDRMDQASELPKTSAASPQAFADVFKSFPKEDQIICLPISSKLSSNYHSARLGAELAERKIWLIDSKVATLGLGILTVYAAEMAKLGKEIEDILQDIHRRIEDMEILIFLDTAKNIVKSGRLSKLAGSLVNLLNLKLLLTNNDGEIQFLTKIRGKKLVFKKLLEMMEQCGHDLENKIIGISHADNLPDAEVLKKAIQERFKPREVILSYMGSCIGTHAGHRALTISF